MRAPPSPRKDGVPDDHVLFGAEASALGGTDRDNPAGQPLARIVVGLAAQRETRRRERATRQSSAPRSPGTRSPSSPRATPLAEPPRDLAGEHPADRPVDVADQDGAEPDPLAALERGPHDGRNAQSSASSSTGAGGRVRRRGASGRQVRHPQHPVRSMSAPSSGRSRRPCSSRSTAADQVVEPPHPQRGHQLPHLLGHEHQVVDDLLRGPAEAPAQLRILGGDPHRARVQMTNPHHDAAHRDQRRGRETELVGARERGHDHVATGRMPPSISSVIRDAQIVQQQRLLGLGQPDLPGDPRRLDRGLRRGPCAAVVAAIVTWSAFALATPAATVPTPTSETSLTDTAPSGSRSAGRRSAA